MRKRILVGDDDQAILDVLRLILEEGGHQVETASGERGLLARLDPPPDLILLDVRLSGTDGGQLCRRLKRHETTRRVPIVMISADADSAILVDECGADAFIAKPFDMDELLDLVAGLIDCAAMPRFVPGLTRHGQAGEGLAS